MPPSESVYCPTPKITRSLLVALLAASGVSERRSARSRRILSNTYLYLMAACSSARTLCRHRGFCAVPPCTSPPTRICAAFRVRKPARPRLRRPPCPHPLCRRRRRRRRSQAKWSPAIVHRYQLWRLVTPVFLHSGVIHIAMNMYTQVRARRCARASPQRARRPAQREGRADPHLRHPLPTESHPVCAHPTPSRISPLRARRGISTSKRRRGKAARPPTRGAAAGAAGAAERVQVGPADVSRRLPREAGAPRRPPLPHLLRAWLGAGGQEAPPPRADDSDSRP